MTLIDDEIPVLTDAIIHPSLSHQALDQRHVEDAGRLLPTSADPTDFLGRKPQKDRQALHPLLEQLPAMDEDQGVDTPLRDQPGGNHGLAEGRSSRQDADVVREKGFGRRFLLRSQVAVKSGTQGSARATFVAYDGLDAQVVEKRLQVIHTPTR